jgi:hypothetical protein
MGDPKNVQGARGAASGQVADTGNTSAVLNRLSQTYNRKDYLSMPMSTLFSSGASKISLTKWQRPSRWSGAVIISESGRRRYPGTEKSGSALARTTPVGQGEKEQPRHSQD